MAFSEASFVVIAASRAGIPLAGMYPETLVSMAFIPARFAAAIVGKPNVGKSSLLNALLQRDRAIVTDTPGTTRDTIEEYLNINGLPLRIIDTAGIRESHDMAEKEGSVIKENVKKAEAEEIKKKLQDAGAAVELK